MRTKVERARMRSAGPFGMLPETSASRPPVRAARILPSPPGHFNSFHVWDARTLRVALEAPREPRKPTITIPERPTGPPAPADWQFPPAPFVCSGRGPTHGGPRRTTERQTSSSGSRYSVHTGLHGPVSRRLRESDYPWCRTGLTWTNGGDIGRAVDAALAQRKRVDD